MAENTIRQCHICSWHPNHLARWVFHREYGIVFVKSPPHRSQNVPLPYYELMHCRFIREILFTASFRGPVKAFFFANAGLVFFISDVSRTQLARFQSKFLTQTSRNGSQTDISLFSQQISANFLTRTHWWQHYRSFSGILVDYGRFLRSTRPLLIV